MDADIFTLGSRTVRERAAGGKTKRFVLDDYIVLSRSGGVGIITLNRPTTSAFWNMSVARQLVLALNAIEFDDRLRAAVLTVAAPSSQLKKVLENQHPDGHKSAAHEEWDRLYEAMCLMKKPRVAAINSIAAGSAFQVALLCDIRIAHARADGQAWMGFRHQRFERRGR